jgi:hypothetical protein
MAHKETLGCLRGAGNSLWAPVSMLHAAHAVTKRLGMMDGQRACWAAHHTGLLSSWLHGQGLLLG